MSKTRFIGVIALLAVVILFIAGCSAGPDPVTVAQQFQEAVNSQDVDSALELLAEDAVFQVDEAPSRSGKAEIENWLATRAELNFSLEGSPTASNSGVTFESCSISSDMWRYFVVNPMSGACQVTLEDGLITEFAVQFDEDSKTRLADSSASTSADLVALWTALVVLPGVEAYPEEGDIVRNYLQFTDDGSARLAVSLDDLSTAPDSDHPGARFKWTYEDYVLTIQNDGPASEGYCLEQDVGTYVIKNVKSVPKNRMQFKLISDSCEYRGRLLRRVSAPWDPYVP